MKYTCVDGVDGILSKIAYGTTSLTKYDENTAALLDSIVDMGINVFDTARIYGDGNVEKVLGEWFEDRNRRDEVVLISKCAHPLLTDWKSRLSREDILSDLETSLEALRTNFVDIYLLHRDDERLPTGPIVETMNELHEAGKIGAFGGSNWSHLRIEEANEYAYSHNLIPFTASSPHYGIAEQRFDLWYGGVTITGEENRAAREWYEKNQMPVFAYSSLACGMFSGRVKSGDESRAKELFPDNVYRAYCGERNFKVLKRCEELAEKKGVAVSQLAIAWMLHQKIDAIAIMSSTSIERMKMNCEAADIELSAEELRFLDI